MFRILKKIMINEVTEECSLQNENKCIYIQREKEENYSCTKH